MIGLDTNVLVRALTDDDIVLSPKARAALAALSSERPGVVNLVVIVEFAWVLGTTYGYERLEIVDVVEDMLRSPAYLFPDRGVVNLAIGRCRDNRLHLADALIGELNRHHGCTTTISFDTGALRSAIFSEIP